MNGTRSSLRSPGSHSLSALDPRFCDDVLSRRLAFIEDEEHDIYCF